MLVFLPLQIMGLQGSGRVPKGIANPRSSCDTPLHRVLSPDPYFFRILLLLLLLLPSGPQCSLSPRWPSLSPPSILRFHKLHADLHQIARSCAPATIMFTAPYSNFAWFCLENDPHAKPCKKSSQLRDDQQTDQAHFTMSAPHARPYLIFSRLLCLLAAKSSDSPRSQRTLR